MISNQYIRQMMQSIIDNHPESSIFDDLINEFSVLTRYPKLKFIWCLHPNGSVLTPIKLGVNPRLIADQIWQQSVRSVFVFLIDPALGIIEKISYEKAEYLIMQMPYQISSFTRKEQLIQQVNQVLQNGVQLNLWQDLFHLNWKEWRHFFYQQNNRLMSAFLTKAIETINH